MDEATGTCAGERKGKREKKRTSNMRTFDRKLPEAMVRRYSDDYVHSMKVDLKWLSNCRRALCTAPSGVFDQDNVILPFLQCVLIFKRPETDLIFRRDHVWFPHGMVGLMSMANVPRRSVWWMRTPCLLWGQ